NLEWDKLIRNLGVAVAAVLRPARLDRDRATLDPTEFAQSMRKSDGPQSVGRRRGRAQEPDRRQLARLLRPRRERPRNRRATEQGDECAARHSITSSTRARSVGGISRPSNLAVCRLMIRSNLLDCTTGRSAGFVPLRMRPVLTPTWRYIAVMLGP